MSSNNYGPPLEAEFEGHKLTIADHWNEVVALERKWVDIANKNALEREQWAETALRLHKALMRYGRHTPSCDYMRAESCSCGLHAALDPPAAEISVDKNSA